MISEIRASLEKVTKTPWNYVLEKGRNRITIFGQAEGKFSSARVARITGENIQNNSEFIVNSPKYISFLLSEIVRLEKLLIK